MRQNAGKSSRSFREEEIWVRLGFYSQLAVVAPLEVIQAPEWHWSLLYQKTLGIPWDMSCANPAPLCPTSGLNSSVGFSHFSVVAQSEDAGKQEEEVITVSHKAANTHQSLRTYILTQTKELTEFFVPSYQNKRNPIYQQKLFYVNSDSICLCWFGFGVFYFFGFDLSSFDDTENSGGFLGIITFIQLIILLFI